MGKEYASLRRKTFFVPFLVGGVMGVVLLAAGYGLHARLVAGNRTTLVMVTRHAEKDLTGGVDPQLTAAGTARAARLASLVPHRQGALGFDRVYVTPWRRSIDTARPVLAASGAVLTRVPADDTAGLVQRIRTEDGGRRVLVVAHSDTVPDIVRRLAPGVPIPDIADDEYGAVYLVALPRYGSATVLALQVP